MKLGELILAHKGDLSYERMAKRATDAGHKITSSTLHNYATKPIRNIPRLEAIHSIATAIGVPPRSVLDASAESLGLTLPVDEEELRTVTSRSQVEALLSVVRHRDPEELEHLNRVVRVVTSALDAGRNPERSPDDE